MLDFTYETQLCASVNITADLILESNEFIRAVLSTQDSAVALSPSMALISVNDSNSMSLLVSIIEPIIMSISL